MLSYSIALQLVLLFVAVWKCQSEHQSCSFESEEMCRQELPKLKNDLQNYIEMKQQRIDQLKR